MYLWVRRIVVVAFAVGIFAVGLGGWYAYFYYTDPSMVRQYVVAALEAALPGAQVELACPDGLSLGGLKLDDVRIRKLDENGVGQEVVRIPRITIHLDRQQLAQGLVRIHKIILEKPTAVLSRGPNGQWDVTDWIGKKPLRLEQPLDIEVHHGSARLRGLDGVTDARVPATFDQIDAAFSLQAPASLSWKGTFHHPTSGPVRFVGSADLEERRGQGEFDSLSPFPIADLLGMLPPERSTALKELTRLDGQARIRVAYDFHQGAAGWVWNGQAVGGFDRLGLDHPKLPMPVRDASGTFVMDRAGFQLTHGVLRLGNASAVLTLKAAGWSFSDVSVAGEVRDLELNDSVARRLPDRQQLLWQKFSPRGLVDVSGRARFKDGVWGATGQADFRQASILFNKFPYPVEQLRGRIELFPDGRVGIAATGLAGGRPLRIQGKMSDLIRAQEIQVELAGEGIPIDRRLREALPAAGAAVFDRFTTSGTTDFVARVRRQKEDTPLDFSIEADLHCPAARCDWFPYSLERVSGHLSITPFRTDFRDFVGTSRGAKVQIEGRTIKLDGGTHVEVLVRAAGLALDDKLRQALPPAQLPVWEGLKPQGRADLAATIIKTPETPLDVRLAIEPLGATVTPKVFPYRLDDLTGRIDYHDQRASWKELKARHGEVTLRSAGEVRTTAEGGVLRLANLDCPALAVDQDFRSALPPGLASVCDFLGPDRPLAAHFQSIEVDWTSDNHRPPRYFFEGQFATRQATLVPALPLRDVTGQVTLLGKGAGEHRTIEGNLALQSIAVSGFQASNLAARLDVEDDRLRLSNAQADFYGGKLYLDLRSSIGSRPRYECDLTGYRARLASYLREQSSRPASADGLVDWKLFLKGEPARGSSLAGGGRIILREADIQGLPIVQDLFRLLSLHIPTRRAFDEVDCGFRLEDRVAVIQKLELLGPEEIVGPSLSLINVGEGTVDLDDYRLELTLGARYARGRLRIPGITPLFNAAVDNLVEIPVGGTLTNPIVLVDALPGLKRMLDRPRFPGRSGR